MTPGAFVEILSEVLGLPRKSVAVIDRVLAVAGLRSLGGRGPSAAQVTPRDAARLLVATMATPVLTRADEVMGIWQRVVSIGILSLLQTVCAEGRTVVMVTHDPAVAIHASRLMLIRDGRIIRDGPVPAGRPGAAAASPLPLRAAS